MRNFKKKNSSQNSNKKNLRNCKKKNFKNFKKKNLKNCKKENFKKKSFKSSKKTKTIPRLPGGQEPGQASDAAGGAVCSTEECCWQT